MFLQNLLKYGFTTAILSIGSIAISLSTQAQDPSTLINALKQGGHIIYFRHEKVVTGERPTAITQLPARYGKCLEPEKTLGTASVTTMKQIGEKFKAFNIPVGQVLSSSSCRAIETAWYTFGKAEIEPKLDGTPRDKIWVELHNLLLTPPTKGTNTIFSTHSTNIKALAGLVLDEGEAVVFTPDGKGGFTQVGRIKKNEW
jgi:hypothetical protein